MSTFTAAVAWWFPSLLLLSHHNHYPCCNCCVVATIPTGPHCYCNLGVHAVTVPHGPDGTICTGPYPLLFRIFSTYWTDSGWTVFAHPCPSKVRPSRPLRRLSNISESSQAPKYDHRYAAQFKSSTFTRFVDYRQMPF